jgi:FixJ family two-component response regulator
MHAEDHYALRALRAGAAGYVNKDSAAEDLSGAVRKVLAGGTHVSVHLAETLAKSLRSDTSRPAHERLSDRELEVCVRSPRARPSRRSASIWRCRKRPSAPTARACWKRCRCAPTPS